MADHCCHPKESPKQEMPSCHSDSGHKQRIDLLLWGSLCIIALAYGHAWLNGGDGDVIDRFGASVFAFVNEMWIGVLLGMLAVGVLSKIPREYIMSVLGQGSGFRGIVRATLTGVLLDFCSHGILLVGMKLYERGASLGQVMAFLIASPWNSLSLTFVMIALLGWKWTVAFIALSVLVALVTGVIFDRLVVRGVLPANPNRSDLPKDFHFFAAAKKDLSALSVTPALGLDILRHSLKDSRMVLRWLLFGIVLGGLIQTFVSTEHLQHYFGASLLGLMLTLLAATVIEVCSEGSMPIASDLLLRAGAAGNAFTFLMAGVATDYTEVMAIKETTKSWKIALFLPLITVPQVAVIGYMLNL